MKVRLKENPTRIWLAKFNLNDPFNELFVWYITHGYWRTEFHIVHPSEVIEIVEDK